MKEQELKNRCTPEFIKWMCELAEGFSYNYESKDIRSFRIKRKGSLVDYGEFYDWLWIWHSFPLLIHRAVEGWNKNSRADSIVIYGDRIESCIDFNLKEYMFLNYRPQSLTQSECATLNCLIDIFKEEIK